MPDHVNKKFLDSFFGKNIPIEVNSPEYFAKQKYLKEEEQKRKELERKLAKAQYISEFKRNRPSRYLEPTKSEVLKEKLSLYFSRVQKPLFEQMFNSDSNPWVMQNTPVGIFYMNKDTGQWMNGFGVVAHSLEELLHASGEDTHSFGDSKPTLSQNSDILPETVLPTPTSALDYAVWATTFYQTITNWNTENYNTLAIVPSFNISGGQRSLGMTTGTDVNYATFKSNIETVPSTRRVMGGYYFWGDIPFYEAPKRDYFKNTADGVTYINSRFVTPWNNVAFTENKQNLSAILEKLNTIYDVDFDYIHDDKETLVSTMDLIGQNYYEGTTDFAPYPGTTMFDGNGNGIAPDARCIPAIISDPRFNSEINPNTGKSVATSIVDYYKTLSGNIGYTGTAEQLLSKWAGITMQGDFCFAGEPKRGYFSLVYAPLFREAIPTPYYTAAERENELNICYAFRATMIEWVYGYYGTRFFTEALNENSRYSNVLYYNYEAFPVNTTEAEFFRNSNDEKFLSPSFPNKTGGKGWYGNNGNIIWASWAENSSISGYVSNPTTDKERYRWCGHLENPYTGPGTLVRYADNFPSPFNYDQYKIWTRTVAHKQFVDDIKNLRHMHRSNTNFWNTHIPYVTPNNLDFSNWYALSLNENGSWNQRYWVEFMYHLILHGVNHINLFNTSDISTSREILQYVLDEWRVISNDSRSRPCSNATGDINSLVDRLIIKDAVTNMVVSGGKLLKTNRYLWRLTASHNHVRANNTIVLQKVSGIVPDELPDEIVIDCSKQLNGYGTWIKRNVSTPPQYVIVPEIDPT